MHLCGYGPGHSAQLDTPALVTGAAPSAPTVGSGRRSAVSSACGFLSASHHPAPLWQGPTLTTPRLHVFRNIKYHHFSPLSRSCFAFFSFPSCKTAFLVREKGSFPQADQFGFFARETISLAHSPAWARSFSSGWLRALSKFSRFSSICLSPGCSASSFSYRWRTAAGIFPWQ